MDGPGSASPKRIGRLSEASVRIRPAIFAAGIVATVAAWLISTPPGGAPDEVDHYLRALSVGQGEWLGAPVHDLSQRFHNSTDATSYLLTTRAVTLPPAVAPPGSWSCLIADHQSSAACLTRGPTRGPVLQFTGQGTRPPFLYAASGAPAAVLGGDPLSALFIARAAFALLALALLVLATVLCWDGTATSILGLGLALTPGLLWAAGQLNPSAVEIAAGAAMAAAAVRLGRAPVRIARGWWIATAGGAVALAAARPSGPAWLLFYVCLISVEAGPAQLIAAARRTPRWATIAVLAGIIAVSANLAWQAHAPAGGVAPTLAAVQGAAGPALASIPETMGEEIGVFGADDILMPRWSYAVWGAGLVVVLAMALLRGRRRDIRILELAFAATFAARWGFDLVFTVTAGSPAQGRHLLPVAVAVPILAGEAVHRNSQAIPWVGGLTMLVAAMVAGVNLVGWYSAAHRFANGAAGSWWIFSGSEWSPPGGWIPSAVLVAAGAVMLGSAIQQRQRPRPYRDRPA